MGFPFSFANSSTHEFVHFGWDLGLDLGWAGLTCCHCELATRMNVTELAWRRIYSILARQSFWAGHSHSQSQSPMPKTRIICSIEHEPELPLTDTDTETHTRILKDSAGDSSIETNFFFLVIVCEIVFWQ